ncbi:microtubule-associated serine/threonine-protein kinase 3-like [Anomaloglossus baeobatrachus]|uniref:microtubule-associated serine/threonine-protein kinase 3-like n=1 Tax=Anomaloglossus baeobatrachus TaxID=238106 RepID=UPI003F4FFB30
MTLVQQAEEKSHSGELAFFKQLAQNVLYVLERVLERPEPEGDSENGEDTSILGPNTSQRNLNSDIIEDIVESANIDHGITETPIINIVESANIDHGITETPIINIVESANIDHGITETPIIDIVESANIDHGITETPIINIVESSNIDHGITETPIIDIVESANIDHGITETPKSNESASVLIESLAPERKPCKSDFKSSKLISSGAFGAVHLVHHKDTNQKFAMKKLDKQKLNKPEKFEWAFLERDILAFVDCPFVVSMFCSFTTKSHLCMVTEYVAGGDCASLLKTMGPFKVPLARMYIAETILAVEYLHSYGVVHRDLKPENLLITATGHIKVTDFGLSKIGLMRPTSNIYKAPTMNITKEFRDREMLGTPYYLAPEVLLRTGYGRPVDWWSVGIILHKFLLGFVPFQGETRAEIFDRILSDNINWKLYNSPPHIDAQNIITLLLKKRPSQRLGTRGANEIKGHPFLCNLDFANLLSERPQYVPQLQSDLDTSHFKIHSIRYKHTDSDEEDTSDEDNEWPESHNFVSSTQRFVNLCATHTRVMRNEDPEVPPESCFKDNKEKPSEIQKEPSHGTEGNNQHFTAGDSTSSSSELSEYQVKKSKKSILQLRKKQKSEKVEEVETRRGSIFRRFISSCRRGLSRAARTMFGCCCCGSRDFS